MSPIAPNRTTRMRTEGLRSLPTLYMFHQCRLAPPIGRLLANNGIRPEFVENLFDAGALQREYVVYHAQPGGEFRARPRPEQRLRRIENARYDRRAAGNLAKTPHQIHRQDVEIAGDQLPSHAPVPQIGGD